MRIRRELGDVKELVLRWPESGGTRPGVRLKYGAGTLGTASAVSVEIERPVNSVIAIGATPEGSETPLIAFAEDAASIGEYGLHEKTLSLTDVSVQATLDAHARAALSPEPVRHFTASVAGQGLAGPRVPRLFDDFDVGDAVWVELRGESPNHQARGYAVVTEAVVTGSVDAGEQLASVTFLEPGQEARVRRNPADRDLALLSDYDRRIRAIEGRSA